MALQKLQLKPGVNRESTSLANEGAYFETDKVRFRSGYPEKLGGWVKDAGIPANTTPPAGSFWGACRGLISWITLAGARLLGLGTDLKYHIQSGVGGLVFDATPIRATSAAGAATFAATTGSATITVTHSAHGAKDGDFVTFSSATGLGGNITAAVLNTDHQITYLTSSTYSITVGVAATAGDSGTGGTGTVAAYQIPTGSTSYAVAVGWGAGGFGGVTTGLADTGWGEAASADAGAVTTVRTWSHANYGEYLIINPRNGPLYLWVPSTNSNEILRAQVLSSSNTNTYNSIQYWKADSDCPLFAACVLVSDASRFVIAFGTNDYGVVSADPMLIRWSDQEAYLTWTPSATNQAGSYRLSKGSAIVTAIQTRQEIVVFTDSAAYSMQYVGPPYVWSTQLIADNTTIMGPNTVATTNGVVYWMGADKFFVYNGTVAVLPCTVRQYVFGDINKTAADQFHAGVNNGFNEIWWFYCSSGSDTVDRYVIYNYLENLWYYGLMARTAWLDTPLRGTPTATGYDGQIIQHEVGTDDGTTNPPSPIVSYAQSADFDIGDGHNYGFVWRIIPDVTFDGSSVNNPYVTLTVRPRKDPGSAYSASATPSVISTQNYQTQPAYIVQQFTEQVQVRVRGRQMAFRIGSDALGVAWQLGSPRIDVRPDGRKT